MPFEDGKFAGLVNSFNEAVSGHIIDPLDWNELFADIEAALNVVGSVSVFQFIPPVLVAAIQAFTSTDDVTAYVQAAVTYATSKGLRLYCPFGRYWLTSHINFTGPLILYGDGWDIYPTYESGRSPRGTIFYADYLASDDPYTFYVTFYNVRFRDIELEFRQPTPGIGWTPNVTPWGFYAYRAPFVTSGGN